jgi:hypothetical protein
MKTFEEFINEGKIQGLVSLEDYISNNPHNSRGAIKSSETLYDSESMKTAKIIGTYQDFKDGKLKVKEDKCWVKIDLPKL